MSASRSNTSSKAIVWSRGASSAATFVLMPYLPVWLLAEAGMSAASVALVAGIGILAIRAGGLFAIVLRRVIGQRALRGCYFGAALALAVLIGLRPLLFTQVLPLAALVAVFGVLLACANVSTKSALAEATLPAQRLDAFGHLNRFINAGAGLGAIAGSLLVSRQPLALAALALALLLVAALIALKADTSPASQMPAAAESAALPRAWLQLLSERFAFLILTSFLFVGAAQYFSCLPVYVRDTGAEPYIGYLFALNAAIIGLFQGQILKRVAAVRSGGAGPQLYRLSAALLSVSVLLLCLAPTAYWWMLFIALVVFTLSEALWAPLLDVWTAEIFAGRNLTSAYTLTSLVWGGMEALGGALSIRYAAAYAPGQVESIAVPVLVTAAVIVFSAFFAPMAFARIAGPAGQPAH
ncbi:MFS transporter [Massilia putida]|uniref:MFS transporter n=1 Tax=Massilia putida TaxID=1141883 RepID=UPI0009F826E6|nr:MFS transporter [Massilia putida]